MQKLIINGGRKLFGEVKISSAKNACLPIISACILFDGRVTLSPCPKIEDVVVMAEIIRELGGDYKFTNQNLELNVRTINSIEGNSKTYGRARASFFTAGAIISRFGQAIVPLPGGCNLGERPIDIHLEALRCLNVHSKIVDGYVIFDGRNKRCGRVKLRYPSVGATVNLINASVYTKGITVISNCAKEPEIKDLCDFLNKCGCKIKGGGRSEIIVEGVKEISFDNISYSPIYDRIEMGTYMVAVASCGGEVWFDCVQPKHVSAVCELLKESGVKIFFEGNKLRVISSKIRRPTSVIADVYPAFPTDMQPQICAYLGLCSGKSFVSDRVFVNRFAYLKELKKFGFSYQSYSGGVEIDGGKNYHYANATITDLRGGAALLIASLCACGQSELGKVEILDRGYERIEAKLNHLGASVTRVRS